MKIFYEEGPETVSMGKEEFKRGIAKDVSDDIARQILGKKSIVFKEDNAPRPPLGLRGGDKGKDNIKGGKD